MFGDVAHILAVSRSLCVVIALIFLFLLLFSITMEAQDFMAHKVLRREYGLSFGADPVREKMHCLDV